MPHGISLEGPTLAPEKKRGPLPFPEKCIFLQFVSRETYKFKTLPSVMYLTPEIKKEIFAKWGKSETDTGTSEGQIALFTHRISHLTEHLKKHKKDHATKLSLLKLVGKRRRLLKYLQDNDIQRYRTVIADLGIRK